MKTRFSMTRPGSEPKAIPFASVLTTLSLLLVLSCGPSATVIELPAAQSMSITGKGPGQDAAINPFTGNNSMAIVENLGPNPFSIRVEDKQGNYRELPLNPGETREVFLRAGEKLYLDSYLESRAKISFRNVAEQ
ncbi:MAG: hypothetical protein P8Z38_02265 [Robiginitalea sp.]